MSAKTIGFGPVLLVLAASAAHADKVLVVVEGLKPGQRVEVSAPALGAAPAREGADPHGVVMTLLDVATAGKTRVAVQREDCDGSVRLSIVRAATAEARTKDGCTGRTGTPFDVDPGGAPSGSTLRIYVQYDSLAATASYSPPQPAPRPSPPVIRPPVPTVISVKDDRGPLSSAPGIKGAKIILVGLTPGLPAEAVSLTTDVIGMAKAGLEPGKYVYQIEAEGYVRAEGKTTITTAQVSHRLDVRLAESDQKVYIQDRYKFGRFFPDAGGLGSFSADTGFGLRSFDGLKMTGSTNQFGDSLNGVRFSTMQNTESIERQNELFEFDGKDDGLRFRIGAGLGEVELGAGRRLSFGAGVSVSNVHVTLDYRLVDPSATGFRTTEWGAGGPLVEADFGAALSGFVTRDRLWFFVRAGAGRADLDGAVRSPSLGGNGVTVIQDDGRIRFETFTVTAGAWYAVESAAFMAAYRYASADITLDGNGALQAAVPQGTLRRDFTFENAFGQDSHQLVGGVDMRVWRRLWVRVSGAVGGDSKSVGFALGYVRNK